MAIVNVPIVDNGGGSNEYRWDILTVPAETRYAITTILVCNKYDPNGVSPEAEEAAFDLYLVPAGDAVSPDNNVVVRQLSLPAGETFTFDTEKVILEAGDKITVDGGTGPGNLIVTVSYLEV